MSSYAYLSGKSSSADMILRSPHDLGALIRDRRRRLGLDQRTLAERAGVSRQWIIEIERGKPRAEVGLVLRTLAALGLRLSVDDGAGAARRGPAVPAPDIDAIVERARRRRP
jgi:HTH-type transcriptional regulator/antitoxin HipB